MKEKKVGAAWAGLTLTGAKPCLTAADDRMPANICALTLSHGAQAVEAQQLWGSHEPYGVKEQYHVDSCLAVRWQQQQPVDDCRTGIPSAELPSYDCS
jgi:hypothetical protein